MVDKQSINSVFLYYWFRRHVFIAVLTLFFFNVLFYPPQYSCIVCTYLGCMILTSWCCTISICLLLWLFSNNFFRDLNAWMASQQCGFFLLRMFFLNFVTFTSIRTTTQLRTEMQKWKAFKHFPKIMLVYIKECMGKGRSFFPFLKDIKGRKLPLQICGRKAI